MRQSELIDLYAKARAGLLTAVPIAGWGFTYWMCGEFWTSVLFGIAFVLPVWMELPSKKEVKHRLIAERKRTENIWFRMI